MTKEHACEALAIHCIDFRFQRLFSEHLENRFPGAYDRIAAAGGVKNLPLEQFELAVRLHRPKSIILIQHEDCGAYGGSKNFKDSKAEQAFQKEELEKAAAMLQEKFLDCNREKYYMRLSGEILLL